MVLNSALNPLEINTSQLLNGIYIKYVNNSLDKVEWKKGEKNLIAVFRDEKLNSRDTN